LAEINVEATMDVVYRGKCEVVSPSHQHANTQKFTNQYFAADHATIKGMRATLPASKRIGDLTPKAGR
jgi:hypothetical protein